jgi:hypothetical protein
LLAGSVPHHFVGAQVAEEFFANAQKRARGIARLHALRINHTLITSLKKDIDAVRRAACAEKICLVQIWHLAHTNRE